MLKCCVFFGMATVCLRCPYLAARRRVKSEQSRTKLKDKRCICQRGDEMQHDSENLDATRQPQSKGASVLAPSRLGIPESPTELLALSRPPSTCKRAAMAHPRSLIAPLSRLTISSFAASRSEVPRLASIPHQTIRCATTKAQPKKKKKARNTFLQYDLKRAEKFSLVDAMQYVLFGHV
jgi:hypothetical protein